MNVSFRSREIEPFLAVEIFARAQALERWAPMSYTSSSGSIGAE